MDYQIVTFLNRTPDAPGARPDLLFASCQKEGGHKPVVLGRGRQWTSNRMKLDLLEEAIDDGTVRAHVIIVCDAYDVLFAAPIEQLVNSFLISCQLMIWSGEGGTGPPHQPHANAWPFSSTKLRYLNAGFSIGYTQTFKWCLEVMKQFPNELIGLFPNSDQFLWCELYLRFNSLMYLDTEARFCLNCHDVMPEDLELSGPAITFKPTGMAPMVFHLNGAAKTGPMASLILNHLGY